MGKTKDTEKRKPEAEEKMDGLEIISIGSLYKGPWDKKYWSSSRGKDRYPYPVGYKACRAHNGTTYNMEIQEGVNGPKFVISYADGHSCSGKTPEIVWEEFQKRSSPRMKIWHGKRLSSKMDGLELFGFKNPLIQRLLRELVADINGTAEQSLVSSNLCDGISRIGHDDCRPNSGTSPDLLLFPGKPQVTGKRSRGCEIKRTKSHGGTLLKRSRPLELTHRSRTSKRKNERNLSQGISVAHYGSEKEIEVTDQTGALATLSLMSSEKESTNHFSSKHGFPLNDVSNDPTGGDVPPRRTSELVDSRSCRSTEIAEKCTEEDPLRRSQNAELKVPSLSMAREDCRSFASICKKSKECSEIDLFAPDTFDLVQENTYDSAPSSLGKNAYNQEAHETAPGGLSEARQGENLLSSNPNPSPEKSGFDSVSEDVAKSMMTLLLPQAIPLLKNSSSIKKFNISSSEMLPSGVTSMEVDNKTGGLLDVPASDVVVTDGACVEREEKMHMPNTDLSSINLEHARSVDSYEYDGYEDHKTSQPILSSDTAEARGASSKKEICSRKSQEHLPRAVLAKTSSMCYVDTNLTKKFCHDPDLDFKDWPQDGSVCIPESMTERFSPMKKVISESNSDACTDLEENPLQVGLDSTQKGPKTDDDFNGDSANELTRVTAAEEKDEVVVKTDNTETMVILPAQVPNLVYSRRKIKYSSPPTGKCLLSETTKYDKIGEHETKETHTSKCIWPPSENIQMITSDVKQREPDSLGIKTRDEVHFGDFQRENSITSSQIELNPSKSENKSIISASKDKLYVHPELADSHVETSQTYRDEKGKRSSLVELTFQNPDLDSCEDNCSTKEAQFIPELKPLKNRDLNNDLDNIVKLVGCYVHPMPVSSLLLGTRENEIYLCVICGPWVDQERTLFTYKIAIKGPRIGCPSLVSYTPILLPDRNFTRETVVETSGLQLTPDGQYNVLLGCIKTPNCREGKICCSCSTCTAHCSENAVKIVQVGQGYVSVVATLETVENMHCILVCEPNQLVSVGESGRLQVWIMNSSWREKIEDFMIPDYDSISPGIVELKKVPKCANLVVGRDCFGEFSLWDISKRNCVSSFSASTNPINQFFPISLFHWQTEDPGFSHASLEEQAEKLLEATNLWFSEYKETSSFLPSENGDLAMWLLVSTASDIKSQHDYVSSDCKIQTGSWRLALLVKNAVLLGSPLDPRAASIGVSGGHGIIGTSDGLVYMWELSRGSRLGTLHKFQDGAVTFIATDDSSGGALAVAGGGKLLVYLQQKEL
ncbi:hypothetical protein L6164_001908 [Bauhinia variegata]|uniref:Uncharacterized protein n=1 Tax=Bauhinia variegata TaxID=167791 RepID=A0ACB9QCH6_BAUVA|nr:hypothetical protein L6164_001908 [Bauhinia variegata]